MNPVAPREGFSRQRRLLAPGDFRRVFGAGKGVRRGALLFLMRDNGLGYCRLGVSIRKNVCCAVQRNRLRRQIREAFRRNPRGALLSRDLVVVVKRFNRDADYWTIYREMDMALCSCIG